jgi:protein ImuB
MTPSQAQARCEGLEIVTRSEAADRSARAALLDCAGAFSPYVEDTAPGICTLELKTDRITLAEVAESLRARLARLYLEARLGFAENPGLAMLAAQSAEEAPGWREVRAAAELHELPLQSLAFPERMLEVLFRWGVRDLGGFVALGREALADRLGPEVLPLFAQATGTVERPLRCLSPAQTYEEAIEFEHEIETLEPLLFILRRFLDRLTLELRSSQHVAAELHLALTLEDETRHARSFRLPEPTADVEILFRALHTHLESVQTEASIIAVQLQLTPARPLVRQQGLFETGLRDPHGFAETLARLAALVGSDRVGTPQLEDTHRPDAVKLAAPLAVIPPPAEPPLHAPLGLPLRRFRPPLPARLEFTQGRPSYVWTERIQGEISAESPDYINSGDWWQQDRAWQRTEWDIALTDGGRYRLLLVNNAWFIEGEYD